MRLLITVVICAGWISASAQSGGRLSDAYKDNMYLGELAMAQKKYEEAIKKYILARISPDAESDGKAERQIIRALDLRVNELTAIADTIAQQRDRLKALNKEIEEEKAEAVRQRDTARMERNRADRNYRLFYSVYVADAAMQDLQEDSTALALKKAFHAYRKLDTIPVPSAVHRTFSTAVYQNFGKLLISSQNAGIIAMEMAGDGQSFHIISRDTSVRRLGYSSAGVSSREFPLEIGRFTEEIGIAEEEVMLTAVSLPADSALIIGGRGARIKRVGADTVIAFPAQSGHKGTVVRIKALPDGRLLSAGRDGKVLLWSPEGEEPGTLVEDGAPVVDLKLSRDASCALIRTMRSLYHWKSDRSGKAQLWERTDSSLIYAAVLSPDGTKALASHSDNQVKLWDKGYLAQMFLLPHPVFTLSFSPDGRYFLIATQNGDIYKYTEQADGSWQPKHPYSHPGVNKLVHGKEGSGFLSIGNGDTIRLYQPSVGTLAFSGHHGPVLSAAFSPRPGDQAFVSASQDSTLKMWSAKGVLLMDLDLEAAVTDVMFTPDGHYILAGTATGKVYMMPSPLYVKSQLEQAPRSRFNTTAVAEQLSREIDQLLGKK